MPLPMPPLPFDCTAIVTSDGSIFAAAAATVPFSVGLGGAAPLVTLSGETLPPSARKAYEPMPAPAPSTAAIAAPAIKAPVRRFGRCRTVLAPGSEPGSGSAEAHPPERGSQPGVAAILTTRQDDCLLLIRTLGLRLSEVWGWFPGCWFAFMAIESWLRTL